jgi:hypothetical protein
MQGGSQLPVCTVYGLLCVNVSSNMQYRTATLNPWVKLIGREYRCYGGHVACVW